MIENPGAYNEARNRLREEKERERRQLEDIAEKFEKEKQLTRTQKKFDIFELRQKIETGNSLNSLRRDIDRAFKEWLISRDAVDVLENRLEQVIKNPEKIAEKKEKERKEWMIISGDLPFGQSEMAKFFENKKIWENFLMDFAGFAYGFVVQWSAILVILLYKIFLDVIFLPRDIYKELKK